MVVVAVAPERAAVPAYQRPPPTVEPLSDVLLMLAPSQRRHPLLKTLEGRVKRHLAVGCLWVGEAA